MQSTPPSIIALIGEEASGWSSIIKTIDSNPRAVQVSLADPSLAPTFLRHGDVALALIHYRGTCDYDSVLQFILDITAQKLRLPVLVVFDDSDPQAALAFARAGALECMTRPVNLARLSWMIDMVAARRANRQLIEDDEQECQVVSLGEGHEPLYIASPDMRSLLQKIRVASLHDSNVLITGETGVGKTRFARALHCLSPRADRPYVVVDCGSIPASLLESELFGHERGSFTGADRQRIGKFAEAQGGTLVLEEVDSLPLDVQSALLRVVEDRVFDPVGATGSVKFTGRIVALTNKNLLAEAEAGRFRSDLYYRLDVASLQVPSLRGQTEQIRCLIDNLVGAICRRHVLSPSRISAPALAALEAYHWPGNTRQLLHTIERLVVSAQGGEITLDHLAAEIRQANAPAESSPPAEKLPPPAQSRREAERERIIAALEHNGYNRTQAAAELGISRAAFYKRLHKLQLI